MTDLDALRFLFITGKGGVGKTTITAALAQAMQARGRRVLITVCDAKERISTLFGHDPLSTDISQLDRSIWAVRLEPTTALNEYGLMVLKSKTLVNTVFDNKYVQSFFAGVPGLHEWAMLGKAWFHATEGDDEPRFDTVLFDAPATGHGIDMLRVPKVIVDVVPPGVLRRDAERAWQMFQDPKQSGVVVVTLPEEMPTNETIELIESVRGELSLPISRLVINGVIEPLFDATEQQALLAVSDLDRSSPGDEAVSCGVRRSIRQRVQEQSLSRLRGIEAEQLEIPLLAEDPTTREAIAHLAKLL